MQIFFITIPCFAANGVDNLLAFLLNVELSVFLMTLSWLFSFGVFILEISTDSVHPPDFGPSRRISLLFGMFGVMLGECSLRIFTRFSFFCRIGDKSGKIVSIPLFLDFLSNS